MHQFVSFSLVHLGIAYNMTLLPNYFKHESQEEAALELNQFEPLIQVGYVQNKITIHASYLITPINWDLKTYTDFRFEKPTCNLRLNEKKS